MSRVRMIVSSSLIMFRTLARKRRDETRGGFPRTDYPDCSNVGVTPVGRANGSLNAIFGAVECHGSVRDGVVANVSQESLQEFFGCILPEAKLFEEPSLREPRRMCS